ncbi:diguanylate cyclase domain-containing protein [Lyngbya sp. PCC 8106]|uniref:diguanylate cyclase domain-containing protein n=1 Tax=Lyngbya sp. (strain PCC 8106) TaxID=313612 RepID=UPI0000EA892C|nr:diguanylate cyclase [Lyngbya sp. PCC 8106]EAW37174.1 regulatory component of sensory transduction system [Lyngbya sp. PCC 8106]
MDNLNHKLKTNILVVDDYLDNLTLLTIILNNLGYQVRQADSGKTALKAVEEKLPDLILLDIQMPEMDGYSCCQQLKANPKTKDIPIIFLSAFNNAVDKVKGFEVGGEDYITKPFLLEEVIARVEKQLILKQQRNQLKQELKYRKKIEKKLLESHQAIAQILEACPDGIAVLKFIPSRPNKPAYFYCTFINSVMESFLKANTNKSIHPQILKGSLDIFDSSLFEYFIKVVKTRHPFERDLYYETPEITAWYSVKAIPYGQGILIIVRDITERKQCELVLHETNSILYQQAITDNLTKISNRRAFDVYLKQEWKRAKREALSLALMMIDIDYFKRYNDHYGHEAGDRCLYTVAQTIRQAVKRPSDFVARYGGEEFAVILPNTEREGAETVADSIQKAIHDFKLPHAQSPISSCITLSIGISIQIPTSEDFTILIQTADHALYEAKHQGRDRIQVYGSD